MSDEVDLPKWIIRRFVVVKTRRSNGSKPFRKQPHTARNTEGKFASLCSVCPR